MSKWAYFAHNYFVLPRRFTLAMLRKMPIHRIRSILCILRKGYTQPPEEGQYRKYGWCDRYVKATSYDANIETAKTTEKNLPDATWRNRYVCAEYDPARAVVGMARAPRQGGMAQMSTLPRHCFLQHSIICFAEIDKYAVAAVSLGAVQCSIGPVE